MNNTIENIILSCKQGSRKAQKLLFETYAGTLLTVSRQYTMAGMDPLDNLQDSFIKIFEKISSYDATLGSFESWARRIVINTALDKLNKNKIQEVMVEMDELIQIAEDQIGVTESLEELMEIIGKLPDGYKQVFCLYEIEGLNHKEIAQMLDIKEVTSRSQLNKSKQMLRSKLEQPNSIFSIKYQSK
ncbi:MAG: sigma-70 family RNA polymerase sigma factor [Chitinophagales bacterium]|nr:sigma-70 family RNA polymerase sigma factor [Chitinophagales bacterium]